MAIGFNVGDLWGQLETVLCYRGRNSQGRRYIMETEMSLLWQVVYDCSTYELFVAENVDVGDLWGRLGTV
jgi:hypothetical protein